MDTIESSERCRHEEGGRTDMPAHRRAGPETRQSPIFVLRAPALGPWQWDRAPPLAGRALRPWPLPNPVDRATVPEA
jgi:hypothetical protein